MSWLAQAQPGLDYIAAGAGAQHNKKPGGRNDGLLGQDGASAALLGGEVLEVMKAM